MKTDRNLGINDYIDSFSGVFQECMDECLPKGKSKSTNRRSKAPWYNDDVKKKKAELNRAKKLFRSEEEFEVVCEKAKTEWVIVTCEKIETCSSGRNSRS